MANSIRSMLVIFFSVLLFSAGGSMAAPQIIVDIGSGDADFDSVPNTLDFDDDNDGIPDRHEINAAGADRDSDHDGIPDRLDLDSDNDGILDLEESGVFTLAEAGLLRYEGGRIRADMGLNGLADLLETDPDSGLLAYSLLNTDAQAGDVLPDFLDLDSDNDGLLDIVEAGVAANLDANHDGRIDAAAGAVGMDGILDRVQQQSDANCCDYDLDGTEDQTPRNTDGGDFPDFQDLDSDNDGTFDLVEAGGRDLDGDGRVDGFIDNPQNPDGVDDAFFLVPLVPEDSNNNGIADYLDVDAQYDVDAPSENEPDTDTDSVTSEPDTPADSSPDMVSLDPTESVDAPPDTGTQNDALQSDQTQNDPIETGLNGSGGCSLVAKQGPVDPLFPIFCLCAVATLMQRRRVNLK